VQIPFFKQEHTDWRYHHTFKLVNMGITLVLSVLPNCVNPEFMFRDVRSNILLHLNCSSVSPTI